MKRFARNAARISMSAISGAIVALSAYSAKADFITQADFDSTAVVSDLNNLGPCCGFPSPFTEASTRSRTMSVTWHIQAPRG